MNYYIYIIYNSVSNGEKQVPAINAIYLRNYELKETGSRKELRHRRTGNTSDGLDQPNSGTVTNYDALNRLVARCKNMEAMLGVEIV